MVERLLEDNLILIPRPVTMSLTWQKDFAGVIKDFEMGERALDYPGGPNIITRVFMCMCIYISICTHIHVYVYTYVYIYTYLYIYMCVVYTHI